ncbi:TPA: autotransporter outer membrane beta-barrel domain-containing protein, partial [Pseudomonas aeruginosa]|nr:autotransporter outer membrane beta-barrel domain-containing protein [Pseudomonas aeruginosa]
GGYTYHLNEQFLVEPRLAARYARVDIDGYHEKGSSAALKVDSQRYEVAELGAGVRVAGDFQVGNGNLQPQAKLMAYHDFAADKAQSTSTFVLGGTPFVSQGAKAVRNSYEAGVGADYHLGAVTVGVSYDYTGKTDFNADTFTAKIRYDF